MSLKTEIDRITTLRNNIRTKLINLGIISNTSAKLQDCYNGLNNVTKQEAKTVNPTESAQTAVSAGTYVSGNVNVGAISSTYVGSGVTKQAAKTVSPTESAQTAVASGVYTTGAVTVGAISKTYVGSSVTRQAAKTVTPTESSQTAVASGVYTTGAVTVGAISKTYVGSGVTKKAAETYTPTTSNQTISAGQYLQGAQTIAGDADLIASNIKYGVNIFNVTGNVRQYASTTLNTTAASNTISVKVNNEYKNMSYAYKSNIGFTPVGAECVSWGGNKGISACARMVNGGGNYAGYSESYDGLRANGGNFSGATCTQANVQLPTMWADWIDGRNASVSGYIYGYY